MRRQAEALERHLEQALREAGVPDRLGLFLDEDAGADTGPLLPPAAASPFSRGGSGPLYLPSRRLEPSPRGPEAARSLLPGGSPMTAPSEADTLVRRVLDAVPARSHALGALLQLFRVEASEDVPTACVSCERRPVLRVNPRFVEEHCRTDAHLFSS